MSKGYDILKRRIRRETIEEAVKWLTDIDSYNSIDTHNKTKARTRQGKRNKENRRISKTEGGENV